MNQNEWYTGPNWDKETQELFEKKLKKSRGSYNKSQYLLIKGGCLLRSNNSYKESAGINLIERLFKDFPSEISNVMFGYEQLGDYYFSKGEYEKAEANYRQSIAFYKNSGRSGSSGIGDIKLAETVLIAGKSDTLLEIYYLLRDDFVRTGGKLIINDDIFRYYSVLAKVSNKIGKKQEANEYAKKALKLSTDKEPQLQSHSNLGIARISNEDINSLNKILKEE